MFDVAELSDLQPPEAADVLVAWHARLPRLLMRLSAEVVDPDDRSELETQVSSWRASLLESLDELFLTVIPVLRTRRIGYEDQLKLLLAELNGAQMLQGYNTLHELVNVEKGVLSKALG